MRRCAASALWVHRGRRSVWPPQQRGAAMSVSGQEKLEINLAVDLYIEGMRTGDAAKLREAFHPQAWMFGSMAGARYDEPIGELSSLVDGQPVEVEGRYQARPTSLERAGDGAFVVPGGEGVRVHV